MRHALLVLAGVVVVCAPTAAYAQTTPVNLASSFNVVAITSDGQTFTGGGIDGSGNALSYQQTGASKVVDGVKFGFGLPNIPSGVRNKVVPLPAGKYAKIGILATAVNGNQNGQVFKLGYDDGTSTLLTQGVSDWFTPQGYTGEAVAVATNHRNRADGTADNRVFNVYAYSFTLDPNKTATSLTLPPNANVVVLAATLTGAGGSGTPLVKVFQHCNFAGWSASFTQTGDFNAADLVARGGVDNDASSVQVATGFKATLYDGDGRTGSSIVLTAGQTACLVGLGFNDVLSSLRIEVDTGGGGDDIDNTVVACGNAPGGNTSGDVPYVRVHLKKNVVKVCVEQSYWNVAANQNAIKSFFDFFDGITPELQGLFSFIPDGAPFLIQITSPTGGACACVDPKLGSNVGVMVTGDAYSATFVSDSGKPVKGFWGYLLTLHEFVNVWTGEMTSGWPTDWWADHRSPFPNAMDEVIMRDLGTNQGNQVLLDAAQAQHERYTMSEADLEVQMFLKFFDTFGGFPAYNRAFALVRGDGLKWDTVSPGNPSSLRTEYVIAYLQLGFRTASDLTQSSFVAAGVGGPTQQDAPYPVSAANVGDIADAHCSIAAAKAQGANVSSQLNNLRHGSFKNAKHASGTCGTWCPGECGCKSSANQCVAKWRAN